MRLIVSDTFKEFNIAYKKIHANEIDYSWWTLLCHHIVFAVVAHRRRRRRRLHILGRRKYLLTTVP